MINFRQLYGEYPIVPAFLEIYKQPGLWDVETARQDHPASPHTDTRAIILRWAADPSPEAAFRDVEAIDYPAHSLLPATMALTTRIVNRVMGRDLGRVMLVELKSGGHIHPHIDEGAYADYYERFHIPLLSEPGNMFYSQTGKTRGEFVHMKAGELWWFNHKAPHWVCNESSTTRLHLIVDVVAPAYRVERES